MDSERNSQSLLREAMLERERELKMFKADCDSPVDY